MSVSTRVTRPPSVSIVRAAVPSRIRAPSRCAAAAERPDIARGVDLGIERAERRADHAVGQDRRDLARLVAVEQPHRDAVGRAPLDELAHDDGLVLGREVDQPAVGPQPEVRPELLGQALERVARRHHQIELRTAPPGVEPDVAEVATRRPERQPLGLEQDDRCPAPGQVIRGRGADDPAADDEDIRGRRHALLLEGAWGSVQTLPATGRDPHGDNPQNILHIVGAKTQRRGRRGRYHSASPGSCPMGTDA